MLERELKTPQTATVAREVTGGFCGGVKGKMERFCLLKRRGHMAAILETGRVRDQPRAALTLNHHRTKVLGSSSGLLQVSACVGFPPTVQKLAS